MHERWTELQDYLGDRFRPALVAGRDATVALEIEKKGWDHWLESSDQRLYYETAQAVGGWKRVVWPFLRDCFPPCRVLDFGCATGETGLHLAALGYDVAFADDAGACSKYLRWRLRRRGMDGTVHRLGGRVDRFDAVVSFGYLNRVPSDKQWAAVERMAALGDAVALAIVRPTQGYQPPLDPVALKDRIAAHFPLIRWEVVDRIVHFVAFRSPPPEPEAEGLPEPVEIELPAVEELGSVDPVTED